MDHFEQVSFLTDDERQIYNGTIENNTNLFLSNGPKYDPNLKSYAEDTRFTFSIFGYYRDDFSINSDLEQALQQRFPNQIYYTSDTQKASEGALLHWTLMQLIGFTPNLNLSEEQITRYVDICSSCLYELPYPLTVKYFGLVATPVNVICVGKSDAPINNVREKIRDTIVSEGLLLKEPYKVNIIHSCIMRYLEGINVQEVLEFCQEHRSDFVKEYTFDKLYLDFGTALMRPHEIKKVAEFDLATKTTKLLL